MGIWNSKPPISEEDLEAIKEDTGFTKSQIHRLWNRYQSLDREGKGYLVRDDFKMIPELEKNPIGDRIVEAFFQDSQEIREILSPNSGPTEDTILFYDFVRTFAHLKPPEKAGDQSFMNSREDKLRFAFSLYDYNNDGVITKDELHSILSQMVGSNVSNDQLISIVERMIGEADQDGDENISFEEFCAALQRLNIEQKLSIRILS